MRRFYAVFMRLVGFPHGGFTRWGAHQHAERNIPMGDLISILAGVAIFALLILYVPACERV
jgi:hypothetical protein